jgi:hypothetical protein
MAISQTDMIELKRIATNTYDGDKACIHRIIMGISNYEKEIRNLKVENEQLKQQAKG